MFSLPTHLLARVVALIVLAPASARAAALHRAARQLPDVRNPALVDHFVDVAIAEETPRVPAELIVAIAWGESRFESSSQPGCGTMQVFPRDIGAPRSACRLWRRDLRAGVQAGVEEIEQKLDDRRVRGNMYLALLYRSCGNSAFDGTCSAAKHAWVRAAIWRWKRLDGGTVPPRHLPSS
jgi:hypothetical protein